MLPDHNFKGGNRMLLATLIVIASFVFSLAIIKMSLAHHEKIQRIKHGYPLNGDYPLEETLSPQSRLR
jgi:hypothetical protein